MPNSIERLLSSQSIHPIVVDIGAAGQPPEIWDTLAAYALYIGFDPDRRDIDERSGGYFWQSKIINQAITPNLHEQEIEFYMTSSPHCSSLLPPDLDSLGDYAFANLFVVEGKTSVRATTLTEVAARLELSTIDWLKLDTQGVDLRIYNSLDPALRQNILAIDIEPGLIDAYIGEDLFIDAHRQLIKDGFWLSNLNVKGSARISAANLPLVRQATGGFSQVQIERAVRQSPGWCEARYLRTLPALATIAAQQRSYLLLWCFAMIDKQFGYAFDIGVEFGHRFADAGLAQQMQQAATKQIRSDYWKNFIAIFPQRAWQKSKRFFYRAR